MRGCWNESDHYLRDYPQGRGFPCVWMHVGHVIEGAVVLMLTAGWSRRFGILSYVGLRLTGREVVSYLLIQIYCYHTIFLVYTRCLPFYGWVCEDCFYADPCNTDLLITKCSPSHKSTTVVLIYVAINYEGRLMSLEEIRPFSRSGQCKGNKFLVCKNGAGGCDAFDCTLAHSKTEQEAWNFQLMKQGGRSESFYLFYQYIYSTSIQVPSNSVLKKFLRKMKSLPLDPSPPPHWHPLLLFHMHKWREQRQGDQKDTYRLALSDTKPFSRSGSHHFYGEVIQMPIH